MSIMTVSLKMLCSFKKKASVDFRSKYLTQESNDSRQVNYPYFIFISDYKLVNMPEKNEQAANRM
ncbi:hypothetical protein BN433_3860 [Erwinia amylovora Ea266]|nr:hypothetical protein BN433_3860 [Erwinia amylovora Ea266]